MHCFWGLAAPQKSPVQPIWRTGEIFRLALHLATGDSDVVTGQSFTIAGGLEGELRPKVSKPVPPAAQCDAIDRVLISLANDQSVSLVKSDLHQMFKFSQFQLGSLYKVSEMSAAFVSPYDMIITS